MEATTKDRQFGCLGVEHVRNGAWMSMIDGTRAFEERKEEGTVFRLYDV